MKCRLSKRSYRLWCHSFQNLSGELIEFYDVDERRTMATQEHYLCTSIAWDPSGRIVTTAVTQAITDPNPRFTNSNAYNLWTFQGQPIHETWLGYATRRPQSQLGCHHWF